MKRAEFLKTGIGAGLLSLMPFSLFAKEEPIIKKNPIIVFTPENLSEFNVGTFVIKDKCDVTKTS